MTTIIEGAIIYQKTSQNQMKLTNIIYLDNWCASSKILTSLNILILYILQYLILVFRKIIITMCYFIILFQSSMKKCWHLES